MRFELIDLGGSRSVAAGDALLNLAATGADTTLVIDKNENGLFVR